MNIQKKKIHKNKKTKKENLLFNNNFEIHKKNKKILISNTSYAY